MGKKIELLPCPFCGSNQIKLKSAGYTECSVYIEYDFINCEECYSSSGRIQGGTKKARKEKLVAAWNKRAL